MLRAKAKEYVPQAAAAYEPEEEPVILDDFMYSILPTMPQTYYIKGGKAFHYYYPVETVQEYIPSSDFDFVGTDDFCTALFSELGMLVGHVLMMEDHEPFLVTSIHTTDDVWKDKVPGKKQKVSHRVRSFHANGIGLVDVIIETPTDVHVSPFGVNYMERNAFRTDLSDVYRDRSRKMGFLRADDSVKFEKVRRKHEKSSGRYAISNEFKGALFFKKRAKNSFKKLRK